MTATIIVAIVLLLLALLIVPFAREMIKDREELHSNPIEQKFSVLAQAINDALMNGKGEITLFDDNPKLMNLMSDDQRNLLINFMYSTGNLTLQLNYKYYHKELVHKELYSGLRNVDNFQQRNISDQFVRICKAKIAAHQRIVTGKAAGEMHGALDGTAIPNDPNDIVSSTYDELSRQQKKSVLILLYKIGHKGGADETIVLNDNAFTLMQLQLKVRWDECKDKMSSIDIYQQLKAADKSIMDMIVLSAMQLVANLGVATGRTEQLAKAFYDEFGKLGYSPQDIDELLQKLELLSRMFG